MSLVGVLDALVSRLPVEAQPYAKAFVPVVTAATTAIGLWIVTGTFDATELTTVLLGLPTALLTYATRNVVRLPRSQRVG